MEAPFEARISRDRIAVHDPDRDIMAGACRLLPPDAARLRGGYEAERHFDLELLGVLRERMVEVGGARIHPEYSAELVMSCMLSALSRYLIDNGLDYLIGAADLDIADGGQRAASIHRIAWERSASPEDYRVYPRKPLPIEALPGARDALPPPVLRAFLDAGAWVSGNPALNVEGDSAIIPFLLPLARMRDRYARRFLSEAA